MSYVLMFQNAQQKLFKPANNVPDCLIKVRAFFEEQGKNYDGILKAFAIRIYIVHIAEDDDGVTNCKITSILPTGKVQNEEKAVIWKFQGTYKNRKIYIKLIDKKDVLYAIWDMLEHILGQSNIETIKDLTFDLNVDSKNEEYTSKQRLGLFFSKPGNWGRLWKYSELRAAMSKEGLAMEGRGIEGERPREFRYDLGYPFLTNEQDKNVPDGSCICKYPFPTMSRNERRNATTNLSKEDWSELVGILQKDPKRLRCYECGLFEEETNKIGQKTKFNKGHLEAHLAGGDVSDENITAICQYCNSEQRDMFNYDKDTGKKIYNTIPFLKERDYATKIKAFIYLLEHLKSEDCKRIIREAGVL